MRALVSRLARLERQTRLSTAAQRFRIQYGYLKTLPEDCTGPRHIVTVRQLPAGKDGDEWFDWEERLGPEAASNTAGPAETIIQVCYVDEKLKVGIVRRVMEAVP